METFHHAGIALNNLVNFIMVSQAWAKVFKLEPVYNKKRRPSMFMQIGEQNHPYNQSIYIVQAFTEIPAAWSEHNRELEVYVYQKIPSC